MRSLCLLAALALAAVGCKKNNDKPARGKADATAPSEPTPDAAKKPDKLAEPTMLNKMKHCPSAIAGAHTTIEPAKDAVAAIVIGKDKPAVATIRERAAAVAAAEPKQVTDPVHDGAGNGGALGRCPSRAPGASVAVSEIEGGVKMTFKPANPGDLDQIVEMLRTRAKALNDRGGRPHGSGGGQGAGGGHGGHGSSGQGGNQ